MVKNYYGSRRVTTAASAAASGACVQIGPVSSASDASTRYREVCSLFAADESCYFGCDRNAAGDYFPGSPKSQAVLVPITCLV
eukprot:6197833-Pleurochrysis_carterae.AAC.2